ncbi:hypothetical protein PMN31_09110, partial [Bifidobacterium pseudocatenulatum]|nr:hypothetical protein [Bifidobacterium pseudocatenulatum]MDB6514021.1 hypothetical protein [Bifidobacterium pseudocatenulatum]
MRPRILDDAGLAGLVTRLIVRERWSPEQIAGRIGVERPDLSVSVSTIYRAVNDGRLDSPELERAKRCLCSISCCGFSHDDFSGLGRACRPR